MGLGMTQILLCLVAFTGFTEMNSNIGQGLAGSAHDFSQASWNNSGNRCLPCHVPRRKVAIDSLGSRRGVPSKPPHWSHTLSELTYTTYTSLDGDYAGQPTGNSKLCLSCHDGTVAIDDYNGRGHGASEYMPYGSTIGNWGGNIGDLSRTHPISVSYDYEPGNIDGLHDPSSPFEISGSIEDVLDNGRVECSSCHDVHNQVAVAPYLLRAPVRGRSQLCLTCHRK